MSDLDIETGPSRKTYIRRQAVVALAIVAGIGVTARAVNDGEAIDSHSDPAIIECANNKLSDARHNGADTAAMPAGQVAMFAANCDVPPFGPAEPIHSPEYYLKFVPDLDVRG